MYIELGEKGDNRWYKYFITIILGIIGVQITSIPLVIYLKSKDNLVNNNIMDTISGDPIALALTLFSFVGGTIMIFIAYKYIHRKKIKDLITTRRRIDFKRIIFSFILWGILTIISTLISIIGDKSSSIEFQFNASSFFELVIVGLIFFPLQTSFEEFAFRGLLMQWCGNIFKNKWAALFITSIAFGLMHLSNPEITTFGVMLALPQYIIMGLILGYITIMDNGLELALGLHFANNFFASILITAKGTALQTPALFIDHNPSTSIYDILGAIIFGAIFIYFSNRKFNFLSNINNVNNIIK